MKGTYDKLIKNSLKYSLIMIGFALLAVMFLYGNVDRDVKTVEEYMEGTVLLNFLVVGLAKGTVILMKVFLVLAAIVAMTLHVFFHLIARVIQNGEPAVWKNHASLVCVVIAFVIEFLLFAFSILASFGNVLIPVIISIILFANVSSERRIWKDGMADRIGEQE